MTDDYANHVCTRARTPTFRPPRFYPRLVPWRQWHAHPVFPLWAVWPGVDEAVPSSEDGYTWWQGRVVHG